MWKYVLAFLIAIPGETLTYEQSDYDVISERFEFSANPKYFGNLKYTNYKYNRTFAVLNGSVNFLVDLRHAVMVHIQVYKFSSNEYRLFPVVMEGNVCEALRTNTFGINNVYWNTCSHAPTCPVVKGHYYLCKWQPDFRKFPPYVPSGSYRVDFKFTFNGDQIGTAQWFATVKRDELFGG